MVNGMGTMDGTTVEPKYDEVEYNPSGKLCDEIELEVGTLSRNTVEHRYGEVRSTKMGMLRDKMRSDMDTMNGTKVEPMYDELRSTPSDTTEGDKEIRRYGMEVVEYH